MRYSAMVLCVLAVGCARAERKPVAAGDTLTVRQRDSVLGASRLPGARGIQRAMTAADTAAAQTARTDSIQ